MSPYLLLPLTYITFLSKSKSLLYVCIYIYIFTCSHIEHKKAFKTKNKHIWVDIMIRI